VPIDVRRFGVGHRRPDGPPGTTGISGQVIESGPDGVISELAFSREARITPHTNPNEAWFIVIEGGGWVGVGDERTRVLAGEAVAWPANVLHGAWTDGAHMRAIVVELPGPRLALPGEPIEGVARTIEPGVAATPGTGQLAPRRVPVKRESADEEPL
jgi:quercetin dioxygenase-like cupin family protein